jgi:hypothetical protein
MQVQGTWQAMVLGLFLGYFFFPTRALHLESHSRVPHHIRRTGAKMSKDQSSAAVAYSAYECGWLKVGSNEAGDVWEKPNGEMYIVKAGIVPIVHIYRPTREIAQPRKGYASLRKLKDVT